MIKIGILHSLTGAMAVSETPLISAAQMAVSEINAAGGVLGKQLETVIVNGASDPLEFSRKAQQLKDDGMTTIFGCWTSASRKAVRQVIEGSDTQLWYPVQYEGLEKSANIYYTGSTLNQQIEPATHWCLEHLGKRLVLLGSDYVFPRTSNRLIRSIIHEAGGEVLDEIYHALGDKNFESTLEKIQKHQPDVILNTLNGDSNIAFYNALYQQGMNAEKYPVMAVSIGEVEVASIPAAFCGHYTCWGYFQSIDTPENKTFIQKFQAFSPNTDVTSDSIATAYSQVHLWAKAVNAAGTLDSKIVRETVKNICFTSPLGQFKLENNYHRSRKALIGKADEHGQFEVVWASKQPITPLPWLGVENLQGTSVNLIKEIMLELPRSIDVNGQLIHEVSERQKAERLILSERKLSELYLTTANVMMLVINAEKDVVFANIKACEVLGYAEYDMLGKNWFDYFLPSDNREHVSAMFEQVISGDIEALEYFENTVLTKSGEERLIAWHHAVIRGNHGEVTHVLSSGEDVTVMRRREKLAQRASEIFKMLASNIAVEKVYDAICLMYEEAHPRMRSSILRLQGNQLFHCSDRSLPEVYSHAINGGQIAYGAGSCGTAAFTGKTTIVEDIANHPFWAAFKGLALPHQLEACWSEPILGSDGQVLGTFAMYFDHPSSPTTQEMEELKDASGLVSIAMEKKNREAWLRKFSLVINQAGEAIMITNKEAVIEFVNPAFEKISGYTSKEVIGKNPRILNSGMQDAHYYQKMWDTISQGEVWQEKIIDKRKDGTFYPAMLMISPIKNNAGDIINFVSVQQDMSGYEALEEQFNQAQKMEAIGTLVGGIAHDFNNTLAGITGNLFLIKKSTKELPKVTQRLDIINDLSMRAAGMINQLLAFARKDLKSMNPVRMSAFLKEMIKFNKVSLPENIELIQDIPDSDMHALVDINLLQQVLLNLLNNARDAVAECEHPRISIELSEFEATDAFVALHPSEKIGARFVRIVVEDNGSGIKNSDLKHIFEPFFTTKEVGKGTGLGLAMSYGAIESHQGKIDVESHVGEGTAFKVYLPLLKNKAIIATNAVDEEVMDGHGETILLVDDEISLIESGKAVLEVLSYKVLTARNGVEAIEMYKAHQDDIDLMITDVVMPKMSGVDAANEIRKFHPKAKILFATGYDRTNSFRKNDGLDSDFVLSKPFSAAHLSQKIRGILD